jgi:hypothetical protein
MERGKLSRSRVLPTDAKPTHMPVLLLLLLLLLLMLLLSP